MSQNKDLAPCHAFWIGKKLGPVAAACLRSFAQAGHPVFLHSYENIEDIPEGVEPVDASQLVPKEKVFKHKKTGSYAPFSDYYRYKMLEAGLGIYIDCDLVCLKPIDGAEKYIFGWERQDKRINNAILKIPPDAPLLQDLLAMFDQKVFLPPWQPRYSRIISKTAALFGYKMGIRHARWGYSGPIALTWYASKYNLEKFAAPPEVYYPLHWTKTEMLLDPNVDWRSLVTPSTRCIHLWGSILKYKHKDKIPKGSPLWHFVNGDWPRFD